MTTLADLKKGERGIIVNLESEGKMKRRLIDMGVTGGSEVEYLRSAPLGDPIEFMVRGYRLSIRKNEAKKIIIEKITVSGKEGK